MANLLNNDVQLATYSDRIRRACNGNVFRTMVRHEGNTIAIGVKGAQHPGLALTAMRAQKPLRRRWGSTCTGTSRKWNVITGQTPVSGYPSIRQAGLRTGHLTTAETMAMEHLLVIHYVLLVVAGWLVVAVLGLASLHRTRVVAHGLFPVGAVFGLLLCGLGLTGVFAGPQEAILPLGLPDLPFHLRLDGLSAYFLAVLGVVSTGVSTFSAGYFRKGEGTPPGLLCFEYHVCLASMALLLLADDAYCFMVAWETMTLSATFLVMTNHRIAEIRRAAFLYFLISHVGALALLLCFGLLQANTGDYTFANMRRQHLDVFWASIVFLLALFGFGTKAGIFPLHVWLPEAHPAAPSPVSALMSGFVLKTGLYGVLRTVFDLLHVQLWWWAAPCLHSGSSLPCSGSCSAPSRPI